MEEQSYSKINIWKIVVPVLVLVFIIKGLNSSKSEPQYRNNPNDQVLGTQNTTVKILPISSPTPNNKPLTYTKPSSKSVTLATTAFSYMGSERAQLIKKFAGGTDNLQLAITNLALSLDRDPQLATKVEMALYAYLLNQNSRSNGGSLYFNGYPCTDDCSGHEAGYDWAEENDIDTVDGCDGNSDSFIEGCQSYVEESYPEENYPEEYDSYEDY